jgi:hypothetical protein
MNIDLHIERLVLDGVSIEPHQRPLLQEALQNELTRLLTERGLSDSIAQGLAMPRLTTAGIQLTGNNPTQLGQQIARSVYGGIGHD